MMTHDNRIVALMEFGYIRREAEFLCLTALHSGYFLRRQYCGFINLGSGWPDDNLVEKILANKHAREIQTNQRTLLYHLCSRPFYLAIGEQHNRHRRRRPRFAIRAKLMALDYVLAHPGRYLVNEAEKLDYFHRERGINMDCLPVKTYKSRRNAAPVLRYFVDKFPISTSEESLVSFAYIDEGEIATPAFETYLAQYHRLFMALERFRVTFVAIREQRFIEAEKTFRRFFHDSNAGGQEHIDRLLTWLRLENLLRMEQYGGLNLGSLEDLRGLRNEFQGTYKGLIDIYSQGGEEAVRKKLSGKTHFRACSGAEFVPCYMPRNYGFLHTAKPRTRDQNP